MPLLVARKPVCCIYYIELSHIHVARFAINLSGMRIEKRWSDCADEQAVSASQITPGVSSVDAHIGAQSILTANGTVFVLINFIISYLNTGPMRVNTSDVLQVIICTYMYCTSN